MLPTPAVFLSFPGGSTGKESTCNAGDLGSTPGLGRSPVLAEQKWRPPPPEHGKIRVRSAGPVWHLMIWAFLL